MVKRIGIEFEMCIAYKNKENLDCFLEKLKPYGKVGYDGSVGLLLNDIERYKDYKVKKSVEFCTKPIKFKNFEELKRKIKSMILDITDNFKSVSINEVGKKRKDINLIFNRTTGTHIHYSDIIKKQENGVKRTNELYYFADRDTLTSIIRAIKKMIKNERIKKACNRRYTNSRGSYYSTRYKQINITNTRNYGTIEFRLFNLQEVKQEEFFDVLFQQIDGLKNGLLKGYSIIKNFNKKLEKRINKELERIEEEENKEFLEVVI